MLEQSWPKGGGGLIQTLFGPGDFRWLTAFCHNKPTYIVLFYFFFLPKTPFDPPYQGSEKPDSPII